MAVEVSARQRTPHDEWFDRRWRVTGLLLGVLTVLAAGSMMTTGMRPATYGDLLSDVASSRADHVQVAGPADPSEGDVVELRWTVWGGLLEQYAVVEITASRAYNAGDTPVYVTAGDPRDTLRDINPDVRITQGSPGSPSISFMGWYAPAAVALLALAAWSFVLLLIIGGPEPWRATRWAWGWAWLLTGPFGAFAYLLLAGPLGAARPRSGHRRVTGGWAFVLTWMVFAGWRETHGW